MATKQISIVLTEDVASSLRPNDNGYAYVELGHGVSLRVDPKAVRKLFGLAGAGISNIVMEITSEAAEPRKRSVPAKERNWNGDRITRYFARHLSNLPAERRPAELDRRASWLAGMFHDTREAYGRREYARLFRALREEYGRWLDQTRGGALTEEGKRRKTDEILGAPTRAKAPEPEPDPEPQPEPDPDGGEPAAAAPTEDAEPPAAAPDDSGEFIEPEDLDEEVWDEEDERADRKGRDLDRRADRRRKREEGRAA